MYTIINFNLKCSDDLYKLDSKQALINSFQANQWYPAVSRPTVGKVEGFEG